MANYYNHFLHLSQVRFLAIFIILFPLFSQANIITSLFEDRRAKLELYNRDRRMFVIANIATQKLRLYQQVCKGETCKNVMVMETPMVVGKDDKESRSTLGTTVALYWAKLYTDGDKKYPPWGSIKPLPHPGSPYEAWNGKGGDFGVYTLITAASLIDPKKPFDQNNPLKDEKNLKTDGQFLHGTKMWPSDGEVPILPYKDASGKLIQRESHACNRVSNQAILFLRNFLDTEKGIYFIKVYALEEGPRQGSKIDHFRYIFTDGKDQGSYNLGNTNGGEVIESGVFDYETRPVAIPMTEPGKASPKHPFINPYKVPLKDFKGKFLVEEGILTDDYKVPSKLKEGNLPYPYFIRKKK